MLQAHSLLWYYLWVAPSVYGLMLAVCLRRRAIHLQYPYLFAYLIFDAVLQSCLLVFDLSPNVSGITWWQAFWAGTIIEGLLKFAILAELLHHLLQSWPSVAKLVRNLVTVAGVILVLLAAPIAAFNAPDNAPRIIGGAHILSEILYFTETGLVVSIFLVAAFFRVPWDRKTFGIALGFGLVWCEHLAVWALVTGGVVRNRVWGDFANMGTYHVAILIWFFYLLVPARVPPSLPPQDPPDETSAGPSAGPSQKHEQEVEELNRELERLIHQ